MLDKTILKVAAEHSEDYTLTLYMDGGRSVSGHVVSYDMKTSLVTIYSTGEYFFVYSDHIQSFANISRSLYQLIMEAERCIGVNGGDDETAFSID